MALPVHPPFIPREGGFSIGEVARFLRVSEKRIERIGASCGVRFRYVSIGKKAKHGPLTVEEARAIIQAFHVKRGARLSR